jgi:hypothetical protein
VSPDFERLVGRAILDPGFRKQLLDDPDGTIKREGFAISPQELQHIYDAAKNRGVTDQKLNEVGVQAVWM